MFHIYKSILILHFLVTIIEAIQWVRVGHKHDDDLPKTEIYHTSDQSYCTINSYYNATTNKYGDAGVTYGMMCDYVFEKGICCGGYFGTTDGNDRLLHSNRCAYLTSDGWVPIENLPERVTFASSVPIKENGVDVGWLISGGYNNYKEVTSKLYLLNSDLTWTTLDTDMEIPLMSHCTVQINDNTVAFIGGKPTEDNIKVEQTYLYHLDTNDWTEGPLLLPEGPDFTARMACHKMPRDNIVVFGCTQTSTDLYYWDLDTDAITKSEYECPTNQGIFGVESNNRLIMTGKTKRSYRFRLNNGFKNYPKAELNHFRGAAFAAPDGTYTCDE